MRPLALICSAALLTAGSLAAQTLTTGPCDQSDGGNNSWFSGNHNRACELRRGTLPLNNGQIAVSGKNGGIELIGEDRNDVALEARVVTQASSREDAESLLHEVRINTSGTIEASGPTSNWSSKSWSVSYRLHVPRHLAARLHTENGGIDLAGIEGSIHAETTNGGVTLRDLAGDVHAVTVNGGLHVTLAGDQWKGAGLFAKATNGGVSVKAPDHYSAHLVAETVNGGISVDFPITVQGRIRNHIDTNIGSGGPTIQLETTNGGVSITHL